MKRAAIIIAITCGSLLTASQVTSQNTKSRTGLALGYGSRLLLATDYDYRVGIFQAVHTHTCTKRKSTELGIHISLQANAAWFREHSQEQIFRKGFETGFNIGPFLRQHIAKNSAVYTLISTGPHYISESPMRQNPGFVFCTYFSAGMMHNVSGKNPIEWRVGVRHLSNLGFSEPNGGINDMVLILTYYLF